MLHVFVVLKGMVFIVERGYRVYHLRQQDRLRPRWKRNGLVLVPYRSRMHGEGFPKRLLNSAMALHGRRMSELGEVSSH